MTEKKNEKGMFVFSESPRPLRIFLIRMAFCSEGVAFVYSMYLVFTRIPGESYRRQQGLCLLCSVRCLSTAVDFDLVSTSMSVLEKRHRAYSVKPKTRGVGEGG